MLETLNAQQRAAVTAGTDPLLIIAGAGTGKTTTLAGRVAHQIHSGIDPRRILLLTFSRRAAREMLSRVDSMLRADDTKSRRGAEVGQIWGGTFHSVATRLLRQHGRLIGLEPEFTILDRSDAEDVMNVVRREKNLNEKKTRFPLKGTCLDIYSRCINAQSPLSLVLPATFPWCVEHEEPLKDLFAAYTDRKETQAVLDYDDLLLFWHALVSNPQAGAIIGSQFERMFVDEFQDTNLLQSEILKHMCPEGIGLTVVGDDAQSIYSFRAATVRNILDFWSQYPDVKTVTLEQNYRSTVPLLEATNRVVAQLTERHAKALWSKRTDGVKPQLVTCRDEAEQTEFLIEQILERREKGTPLKQQAVLYRTSHHSMALEVELSRRNIPFHKYGGLKFIETAHVKDLLGFLKLAENPRDATAATRVLLLLPGIGAKTVAKLLGLLQDSQGDFAAWSAFTPPSAAKKTWTDFITLLHHLNSATGGNTASQVHAVRTFYGPLLERLYDHPQPRLRDLEQIEQLAGQFTDRATFLADVTLDPPASTQDLSGDPLLDEDYLILSTIHSAKGLEWDSVYVIHAADGNIPSDMATGTPEEIDEELRLFYVALSRAKNHLVVCHPQRYYFHGRYRGDAHGLSQLTRFLNDDNVKSQFTELMAGPDIAGAVPQPHTAVMESGDVRESVKKLF